MFQMIILLDLLKKSIDRFRIKNVFRIVFWKLLKKVEVKI
jgi:hypothetical protein